MTMRDIALIGHMRAGKDSVAAVLTQEFGYQRLSFADRLKAAALEIDLRIQTDPLVNPGQVEMLSAVVRRNGWDGVKTLPAVRCFLQNLGHAMRQVDEDIWIRPVLDQIDANWDAGVPTVVSDCRYRNEAETLRDNGFTLVRIVRPGTGGDEHVSETELDGFEADYTISNDACLEDLAAKVRLMVAA